MDATDWIAAWAAAVLGPTDFKDFLGDLFNDWFTIVSSSKKSGFRFLILAGYYKKGKLLVLCMINVTYRGDKMKFLMVLTTPLLLRAIGVTGFPFPFAAGGGLVFTSVIRLRPNISGPKVIAWFPWSESSSPKSSSLLTLNPPFLKDKRASADSARKQMGIVTFWKILKPD